MTTLTVADYLKYANLQMAAEALYDFDANTNLNLIPGAALLPSNGQTTIPITDAWLTTGNRHASTFTPTQVALSGLTTDWVVVEHKSNTTTGFSGTLFKNKDDGKLVLSFRSTEFIDDTTRDSEATNSLEIDNFGWAFGQIDDMQAW